MVGQFTDRHGYARNFAFRIVSTVATSPMDDGHVEELNPATVRDSTIDGRLYVQAKDMREVVGLLSNIAEKIVREITAGKHTCPLFS